MIEQTFSVTDVADLEISVPTGSLTVESGPTGTVEVTVDTKNSEGWRLSQTGDSIFVGYERGTIGSGGRARVRVVAPEGSSLKVSTASGSVRAQLELNRVTVNTASGDVYLEDARSVAIKTASGDVVLGNVGDEITVRSASGDVRVSTVGGAAGLTTASGDISIERARGPLSVTSASGDLRLGVYLGDDLEAATMSGDLTVGLPAGRTVKLRANTLSGSVRLPERRPTESSSGPTVSIGLKSVSGDLTIRRVE